MARTKRATTVVLGSTLMTLFIGTRGSDYPWLNVPTVPDGDVPREVLQSLREVRAILRSNAAILGQPCHLRAVVVTGPEVGGPHVALVVTANGRIGPIFKGITLEQSAATAVSEAKRAAKRAKRFKAA